MSDVTPLRLLGVQVGRAAPLPVGDRSVMSGIRKHPVTGPVAVRPLGLAGDEQADLTVHGGLWKAVYAYPVEHYPYWQEWRRTHGFPDELPFGTLGENLTIQGLLETELFVGDCLRFPECELRVTQPRQPCYKFAVVMGDAQAARAMVQTGFCGFYLAADQPGQLEAGQSFDLVAGPRELPLMDLFPKPRRRD
ncbi:MAG: MOSC domain-containing protein [Steroidobacteraceae bacterium]